MAMQRIISSRGYAVESDRAADGENGCDCRMRLLKVEKTLFMNKERLSGSMVTKAFSIKTMLQWDSVPSTQELIKLLL